MLVFRRKRAPPGPTHVPCPVPLAALRTPPDHTCCTRHDLRRQAAPNRRRTRRLAFAIAWSGLRWRAGAAPCASTRQRHSRAVVVRRGPDCSPSAAVSVASLGGFLGSERFQRGLQRHCSASRLPRSPYPLRYAVTEPAADQRFSSRWRLRLAPDRFAPRHCVSLREADDCSTLTSAMSAAAAMPAR